MKHALIGILLFALSLAVFHTYLRQEFPYTNDGENHLARFANYKIALKEGQIPPRFAPNLMNHYGYPVFDFNYPLANMLSVPLSFLRMNPELTFKIISIGAFIGGLVGIYKLLRRLKSSLLTIVIGMILFGTQPYIVNLILFRGSIGELLALALLPWVLYSIHNIIDEKKVRMSSIVTFALFLLSHNVTVLLAVPFLCAYSFVQVFKSKNRESLTALVLSGIGAILLTLWFWLPALFEASLTVVRESSIANQFFTHFVTINELLFGHLGFGFSSPGPVDSMGFQLGAVTLLVIFVAVLVLFKSLVLRVHVSLSFLFLLVCVLLTLIFQLEASAPIWRAFPALQIIQFPWRLSILLSTLVPLLWAESAQYYSRSLKKVLIVLGFCAVYSIAQLTPVDFFHRNQIDYDLFSQSTSTQNENRTKEFTYLDIGDWQPKPTIQGVGSAQVIDWTGSHRSYQLNLETSSMIIEPTMNFLGWQTRIVDSNGKVSKAVYVDNRTVQGRLAYELPKGSYLVKSVFTEQTSARITGDISFFIGAILLIIMLFKQKRVQHVQNHSQ